MHDKPPAKPQISVVIPCHNRRHTLARAIDSVLAQDYPAQEIIIVDDGSSDGTKDWLQTHYPAARYPQLKVFSQQQHGVSQARNRGIQQATGDWIALLDSDDEWLPGKLRQQVAAIRQHPATPLVHTNEIWIRNGIRVNAMQKHQKSGGRIFQRCLPLCVISPSSALIRKDIFAECGLFDESLPACEDYDLWLRICARYSVTYIETPLIVKYGGHTDQLSRQHWGMDRFRVKALSNIIDTGCLNAADKQAAIDTLLEKCRILLQGARKRQNHALQAHYQSIIQIYQTHQAQSWHRTSASTPRKTFHTS